MIVGFMYITATGTKIMSQVEKAVFKEGKSYVNLNANSKH